MTFPMSYDNGTYGEFSDSSKEKGWNGLSSLEKSLAVALSLVSLVAIGLMIAVIIVGIKLSK